MGASPSLNRALLHADLWRVLALTFCAPTTESLSVLRELARDVAAIDAATDLPFRQGLTELADAADPAEASSLEHEYNALFFTGVLVPPCEGGYQRIERGAVIGDVAGYFQAFDLRLVDGAGPPDALWNELAFLAWLSLKEAHAIERGREENAAVTREAAASFLCDHLGRWAGAFCQRLFSTTGNPVYVTGGHLLLATVSLVADQLNVDAIQPLDLDEHPDEAQPVTCPLAGTGAAPGPCQ